MMLNLIDNVTTILFIVIIMTIKSIITLIKFQIKVIIVISESDFSLTIGRVIKLRYCQNVLVV